MSENRVIYFVKRPVGVVTPDVFEVRREPMPSGGSDRVVVESVYVSVDPYMAGRMSERKSYIAPFHLNQPMEGGMVGRIVNAGSTSLAVGTWVSGMWPWAEYAAVSPQRLTVLDEAVPPTAALHVLGLTGLTAYLGLTKFGAPKAGDQLVVSAAAGSVGSLAGQIGRLLGLKVVGVAGGREKCHWLTESLGFEAAIDYQRHDFPARLQEVLPHGVDIYFDNVGGVVTDAVMTHLNPHARIVVCGQIACRNPQQVTERARFSDLLIMRSQATGFIVTDYEDDFPEALHHLRTWYLAGQLHAEETLFEGFDHIIEAFIGLFHGANRGKALVKLR